MRRTSRSRNGLTAPCIRRMSARSPRPRHGSSTSATSGGDEMPSTIHPTADVSPQASVGEGTHIWHWVQVREGARIGRDCRIGKDVYIDKDVVLGDGCKVQNFATIYEGVTLGDRVFVGPHAVFTNDPYPRADPPDWAIVPTRVEDGASIGANATIVCGVTIGRRAMVAAGARRAKDGPAPPLLGGGAPRGGRRGAG